MLASLFPPQIATRGAIPRAVSNVELCLHHNRGLSPQALAEARHAWVLPCSRWFSPQKCQSSDKQSRGQSPRVWGVVTVSVGLTTSHPISVGKGSSRLLLVGFGEMKAALWPCGNPPTGHYGSTETPGSALAVARNGGGIRRRSIGGGRIEQ